VLLVFVALTIFALVEFSPIRDHLNDSFWMVSTLYGGAIAWPLLVFLWSFIGVQERPHGVPLSQIFRVFLLGPLRPDIKDYDKNG
jgi:hypothetical protein